MRALEQARRRFQQAFHSAPTGMALVRLDDSRIVDANRSLAEMLQRPVDELVGRSIREITHPDDLRTAAAYRNRLELGIVDTYLLDQRYLRSDGEYIWARTRVAVTEDEGVALAITHIEDVTEQLRTAEQLQLGGDPRRADRPAQPHRAARPASTPCSPAPRSAPSPCCSSTSTTSRWSTTASATASATSCSARCRERLRRRGRPARRLLGRFGGDEFIVVLRATTASRRSRGRRRGAARGDRREPVDVEGTELYVTASIGVAVSDATGSVGRRAAPRRRRGDVSGQGARARLRRGVRAGRPRDHGARPADRDRAAPRHRAAARSCRTTNRSSS